MAPYLRVLGTTKESLEGGIEEGAEGGLAAGKDQGSMGKKHPFLEPQHDKSSEEWRRLWREGGNRKGGKRA